MDRFVAFILVVFICITFSCCAFSSPVYAAEILLQAGSESFYLFLGSLLSALGVSIATSSEAYRDFCDAIQPSMPPGLQGVYNNFLVSGAYAMTGVLVAAAYDWLATDDVQSHVISAPGGAYLTSYGMCIDGVNVVVDAPVNFTLDDCRYFFVGSGGAIKSIGLNVWHDFTFFPSLSHPFALSLIHRNDDNYDGVFYFSDHTTFVSQLRFPRYLHFFLDYNNDSVSRLRVMSSNGISSSYSWVLDFTQYRLSASTAADLRAVYNSLVSAGADAVSISIPSSVVAPAADEVVAVTVPGAAALTTPADVAQLVDDYVAGEEVINTTVSAASPVALQILSFPIRRSYQAGDAVDLSGLTVALILNTGEAQAVGITDVVVTSPADGVITATTTAIDISIDSLVASIPITVTEGSVGGVLEYLQSLVGGLFDTIKNAIIAALEYVFAPDPALIGTITGTFSNKFRWVGEVYRYIKSVLIEIYAADSLPVISANFSSADSKYFNIDTSVNVFDLSWYAAYKPSVDTFLSAFIWLFFMWRLFKRLPSLIGGNSTDSSGGA